MKWFKHISDSLDDPFIFDLLNRYGADGYLVFFGILEIYSREFKAEPGWNLSVTRSYLKQKLCKRQDTLIIKSLEHIKNSGKWDIFIDGEQVVIYIPKFHKLVDEFTSRKIGTKSTQPPKKIQPEAEEETEKEIKALCKAISEIIPRKTFNPYSWCESFRGKNPEAIIHTMKRILKEAEFIVNGKISNPWGYAKEIISKEDGKYNAQEYVKEHQMDFTDVVNKLKKIQQNNK